MSGEQLRDDVAVGLVGMAVTSPTKDIVDVNDEICVILGYDRAELLIKSWAELTHPADLHASITHFTRVMSGEIDDYTIDTRWVRKDGDSIDVMISMRAVRRADGAIVHLVTLLQEVTERTRPEQSLRDAHEEPPHLVMGDGGSSEIAQEHVRRMLGRIEQSYSEPITLRSLADELHRQSAYLGGIFRRGVGMSVHEWLTRVRLDRASVLIREGVKVEAVSMLVGYRSKKNFYRQFKRRFGTTQFEHRNAARPQT
jgi:PAS domain S-box-containing protein